MKVFYNLLGLDIDNTILENMELVSNEYYSNCTYYVLTNSSITFLDRRYVCISFNSIFDTEKIISYCYFLAMLDQDIGCVIHNWDLSDEIKDCGVSLFHLDSDLKEVILKINLNKFGSLEYSDISKAIKVLVLMNETSSISSILDKMGSVSNSLFNQLDEIFISSGIHSNALNRSRKVLDVDLFVKLKNDFFCRKNKVGNEFLTTFFNLIYNVVDNIIVQCGNSNNNTKSIFKSYKSLSNLSLHLAKYKYDKGYSNQCFITLFRVLEFYFTGFLFVTGDLEFRNNHGNKDIYETNGDKVKGFGVLFNRIKSKSILPSNLLKELDSYIILRNCHLYGHGFYLSGPVLNKNFFDLVINIVTLMESNVIFKDNSWSQFSDLNKSLFNFDYKKHFENHLLLFLGGSLNFRPDI
ncbi:hypothetical protein [Shewanella baltica]|uniref:hypothetical protein n=1 Tax=Shewanella baltica TaxID=62322 RepID=UPI00325E852B